MECIYIHQHHRYTPICGLCLALVVQQQQWGQQAWLMALHSRSHITAETLIFALLFSIFFSLLLKGSWETVTNPVISTAAIADI